MHALLAGEVSDASSPVERWCLEHLTVQFQHMSPFRIWEIIATIQNRNVKKTVGKKRKRQDEIIDDLLWGETIHTCTECGGHDIINNQVQVRGADEPMTQFLFCQTCGAMWKEE